MPSAYTTGLTPDQLDDLVNNTLHKFEKDKWIDISTELQRYFAYENMLLNNRIGVDGGDMLQWQVKTRNTGAAKNTGMYAVDDVNVADVTKHAKIGWTKQTTSMGYDQDEAAFNEPSAVRILALLKTRRHDALTSLAELMESNFWGLPLDKDDAEEMKKPLGVPYWITRNANLGFNGSLPVGSNFTDVAGLNPTTLTRWRNFSGAYKVADKFDLIRKMREGTVKCNFRQPISHPTPKKGGAPRYTICTVYEIIAKLEEILEVQNSNLGNDVASKDGDLVFRRTPVTWVPYLDANHDPTAADTTNPLGKNPVYGIDRNSFRCVFKSGSFMKRSKPIIAPNQHSVRHIHWDCWMNFQCLDRRSNWVFTQSA